MTSLELLDSIEIHKQTEESMRAVYIKGAVGKIGENDSEPTLFPPYISSDMHSHTREWQGKQMTLEYSA